MIDLAALGALAWFAKELIGEGAGIADTILYHAGLDENSKIRKWTDFLDEFGAYSSALEDYGLAPRKADTPLGETLGVAASALDFLVPVTALPTVISGPAKIGKAAKLAMYGARTADISGQVGKALFPQSFPVKPVNIQFGNIAPRAQQQQQQRFWGAPAGVQFPGAGNMGDIISQNINAAAALYPHLWAAAAAEQARRDRENRAALEQAMRQYAAQVTQVMSMPLGYQVPAFW